MLLWNDRVAAQVCAGGIGVRDLKRDAREAGVAGRGVVGVDVDARLLVGADVRLT